jgi:hypothetical protein
MACERVNTRTLPTISRVYAIVKESRVQSQATDRNHGMKGIPSRRDFLYKDDKDVSRRLDLMGELRPEQSEIFMQGRGGVA